MGAYVVRRVLLAVLTLWIVSWFSWVLIQVPEGDYADAYMARMTEWGLRAGNAYSPEEEEQLRERLGLNRPLLRQYWDWMFNIVVHGDFGLSYTENRPIGDLIAETLPFTVALTAFTIGLTWMFAIPIGIYSAMRQHSIGDYAFTLLGFTGLAVPDFLLALVLMYIFFAYFDHSVGGLFSGDYRDTPWSVGKVLDLLQHMIVPAIVMGTSGTAGLIRIMRNNLLDELDKPYVVTALAKGMVNWRVIAKYPVRIAINPFVSGIGYMLPALVGGSVIVSIVLSLPTLGPILLEAIQLEDPNTAGAIILMLALLTVVGVLVSDLLLVLVDPRIRLTGRGS